MKQNPGPWLFGDVVQSLFDFLLRVHGGDADRATAEFPRWIDYIYNQNHGRIRVIAEA